MSNFHIERIVKRLNERSFEYLDSLRGTTPSKEVVATVQAMADEEFAGQIFSEDPKAILAEQIGKTVAESQMAKMSRYKGTEDLFNGGMPILLRLKGFGVIPTAIASPSDLKIWLGQRRKNKDDAADAFKKAKEYVDVVSRVVEDGYAANVSEADSFLKTEDGADYLPKKVA